MGPSRCLTRWRATMRKPAVTTGSAARLRDPDQPRERDEDDYDRGANEISAAGTDLRVEPRPIRVTGARLDFDPAPCAC